MLCSISNSAKRNFVVKAQRSPRRSGKGSYWAGCMILNPLWCHDRIISAAPPNPTPFEAIQDVIDTEFTTKIPLKAGWALFYDARLIHGSDGNMSNKPRAAFSCGFAPKGVPLRLYFWDKQAPSTLDIYEITDELLLAYSYRERPDGVKYLGSIKYEVHPLTVEDLRGWPQGE